MLSIAEVFCLAVFSIGMPRAEFACKNMETVIDTSHKYDIRPELLIGLIWTESGWNHEAVSNAGACGLTQVLPKYTKNPKLSCKELKDPTKSITTGGKIFNFGWISIQTAMNVQPCVVILQDFVAKVRVKTNGATIAMLKKC